MQRPIVVLVCCLGAASAVAQDADQLAKQLQNPIASLTSVPLQLNFEREAGAAESADRIRLNVQPVIPKDLGEDWNLISRTILPILSQDELFTGMGSKSGIGDVTQSFFFSPEAPTKRGLSFQGGVGRYADAPQAAPDWGLRFATTFMFPKR